MKKRPNPICLMSSFNIEIKKNMIFDKKVKIAINFVQSIPIYYLEGH